MSLPAEILLEGSYLYYDHEVNYSQENFKLVHFPTEQLFHLHAEVVSRIENGEFLKIIVRYEMNQNFFPSLVRIEKSIGNKYAVETYRIDSLHQDLHYTFEAAGQQQEYNRNINTKHYITSPAFSSSLFFTISKRFDQTGRSPVIFVNTPNEWTYVGPPTDKITYAEYKSREMPDFKLNNSFLAASHLCLYEHDSSSSVVELPVDFYVSKYYGIPYQMNHGHQKIIMKNLKKNF